jgi:hypothetical protein
VRAAQQTRQAAFLFLALLLHKAAVEAVAQRAQRQTAVRVVAVKVQTVQQAQRLLTQHKVLQAVQVQRQRMQVVVAVQVA